MALVPRALPCLPQRVRQLFPRLGLCDRWLMGVGRRWVLCRPEHSITSRP